MHEADADAQLSITWGIVVGLLASFVQSLGLTIQRKSHVLNQQLAEADQRADHRRPYVIPCYFLEASMLKHLTDSGFLVLRFLFHQMY